MLQVRFIFTLLIISLSTSGQVQIKIGDWREHLPYQKAKSMLVGGDHLYCLTESGLFSYSVSDNEIVAFSKTKGLSESEISSIDWVESSQSLLIGYASGNLDVISDGDIQNISDIKNFSLVGSKSINLITSNGDLAYLGTDFGIVVINMDKMEVADTYFIGVGGEKLVVNDIEINSSLIWVASDLGIFKADLSSGNLADFNNWEPQENIPDFQRKCTHLEIIDGDVFVSRSLSEKANELYRNRDGIWSKFPGSYSPIYSLRNKDDQLWVVQADKAQIFNLNGIENTVMQYSKITEMRDALEVNGRTFIADYQNSLMEINGLRASQIKPDGPLNLDISNVYSVGEQTWAVAGGLTSSSYEGLGAKAELNLFEDQKWTNYSNENALFLNNKFDLLSLTGNKREQSLVYVASWGDGIFVFENKEYQANWNFNNSPLGTKGISGMDSDEEGQLWILDANSSAPVKILSLADEWTSLTYSSLANRADMQKIVCLTNGDKWVLNAPEQALFAFNEKSTLSNQDDDAVASFLVRDEHNATISSKVYDLVEDDNGDVWLGTSSGLAVYSSPGNIFRDGDFFAYKPIITIDGSSQFLLGTERVNAIALNGANQKWLGTANSGVFLVSENGDEQLAHFTNENSPLPSNTIQKISVNPGTGKVFFVTDKGMVSYRGEVTAGTESYNDLYVYPNPVRETYYGDVVVSGLIAQSIVKITDISGNLVIEGKSDGGQFVWDGKNFNGSRVHTGVYLIFCSNSDGSKSKVIKLLFIHS